MRPTRVTARLLFAALVCLLAACGQASLIAGPSAPPPIVLELADGSTEHLEAWTYCYGNGCADGAPPRRPVDIGSPSHVDFTFEEDGWTFEATFNEPGVRFGRNGRNVAARVEKIDDHTHRVFPAGRAGTWHVDVFGRGESGDAIATFAWTTTDAGEFPHAATGTVAVLAEHDGVLDSYGVELGIRDLASTPRAASASITITNEDGRAVAIDLGRPTKRSQEGTVSWRRGAHHASDAVALGGSRFDYEVSLVLDGTPYTGRGTWPDDTNEEITPSVPLTWTPPLPVYGDVPRIR